MSVWRVKYASKFDFGSEDAKQRFLAYSADHPDAAYKLEHQQPVRSMSQHRLYWVYMQIIAHETGHTPEEVHAWVKHEFLPVRYATVFAKDVPIEPSTTTLNKADFGDLLERVCARTCIPLPDPQAAGYISNH
jgi:prophage antirepressor-like protein